MKIIFVCCLVLIFACFGSSHDQEPLDWEHWIEKYNLTFQGRKSYTSSMNHFGNPASDSTADWFYGLIKGNGRANFYRIPRAISLLNLIRGAPINIYTLDPSNGDLTKQTLGGKFSGGLVRNIPAGHYLAMELRSACNPLRYSLYNIVTLSMIQPDDIKQANRTELMDRFPQHGFFIRKFTTR